MWSFMVLLVTVFVMGAFDPISTAPTVITTEVAYNYLMQYGYGNSKTSVNKMGDALKSFQSYMGLDKTGLLDDATKAMMILPRCGFPDKDVLNGPSDFVINEGGRRWDIHNITYRISKYSDRTHGLSQSDIDRALAEAFQMWSDVTPLTFTPVATGPVHIDIGFFRGEHQDPPRTASKEFDGYGGTLAHAYFPFVSATHFDDDEIWKYNSTGHGRDLVYVATHEFGHALGLDHSNVHTAVMYMMYMYEPNFKLHEDDIQGIRYIYGPPRPLSGPTMALGNNSELCNNPTIDAALTAIDGSTYVFKGDKLWKLAPSHMIAYGYPQSIRSHWPSSPSNINAAFVSNNKTYILKRSEVWRYTGSKLDKNFPQQISRVFPGIDTSGVDLAFVWSGNGKTYFFKGDHYYRYLIGDNSPRKKTYPRPVSDWGLPNSLDAAMSFKHEGETKMYFFKGSQVYKYSDERNQVDEDYPVSSGDYLFGCSSNN